MAANPFLAAVVSATRENEVEVWPENWQAFELFCYMQTQWYVSMGGPTGLRYSVLHHKMDRLGLSRDEYEQLEDDVRTMEFAALAVMHEKND